MFVQDKKYFLEDLGSTNGTFINGQRVQMPTQVHDKDSVEFGESIRLQFLLSEPDEIDVPTPAIEVEYRVEPRLGPTKPLPGEPPPPPLVRPSPTVGYRLVGYHARRSTCPDELATPDSGMWLSGDDCPVYLRVDPIYSG